MKKRIESLLMALCLCLSLLPAGALAEESITASVSKQAVMSATGSPLGYDAKAGKSGSYDQLYFGTYYKTETGDTEGTPHAWRILDGQTNTEKDGLFLLSMKAYGGIRFALPRATESSEEWWKNQHNVWSSSLCAARLWCGELAKSGKVFSEAEQGALFETTKSEKRYSPTSNPYFVSEFGTVLTGALNQEKVFYLSVDEFEDARYGLTKNAGHSNGFALRSRADNMKCGYESDDVMIYDGTIVSANPVSVLRTYTRVYAGSEYSSKLTATEEFFLGSFKAFGFFPSFGSEESYVGEYTAFTAYPAMNLSGDKLLYITAADNDGHRSYGTIADDSNNWEWKAVVTDGKTAFRDGTSLTNAPDRNIIDAKGYTMQVKHPTLNGLGDYDVITASLADQDGKLIRYGTICTEADATRSEVEIPAGLADGVYTLRITAEKRNGEKLTDLAAEPLVVEIKVASPHNHPVCGIANCTDEAHGTHGSVEWKPVTTTAELAAMTAEDYCFLIGNVAAPDTACYGHLCVNGYTVTGELKAGDGFSLCGCKGDTEVPKVAIEDGAGFDQYGLQLLELVIGEGSTLNMYSGSDGKGGSVNSHTCTYNQIGKNAKLNLYRGTFAPSYEDDEGGNWITDVNPSEGCEINVYDGGCLTTVDVKEPNVTVTVHSGGDVGPVRLDSANTTLTVKDGGSLDRVQYAMKGSTINLYNCTIYSDTDYVGIYSSGEVNLYGAVSGGSFRVDKPLNICAPLGAAPSERPIIIMDKATDGQTTWAGSAFTKDWQKHMGTADGGDYFRPDVFGYGISTGAGGELYYTKVSHDHPVCGAACTHTGSDTHPDVTWTEVSQWSDFGISGTTLNAGSYCLMGDVKNSATGGTITVSGNVSICLDGFTLDLNGGCFELASGATLTICDCEGSGSTGKVTSKVTAGHAVKVPSGAAFTLYGGEISTVSLDTGVADGAVYVNGGTFTMEGGKIKEYIDVKLAAGEFYLKGGTLADNLGEKNKTAAVWQTGGAATMTGGAISAYTPLYISSGTFTLSSGSIHSSSSEINVNGGTFQINGGSVTADHTALKINSGGTVDMTGGRVAGRTAVTIVGGTFRMSGGDIGYDKQADSHRYGVQLESGAFNMSGGEIKGYWFGGVAVNGGEMTVSGTAKIIDNGKTSYGYENPRNVALAKDQKITVGALSEGAEIGISMVNVADASSNDALSGEARTSGTFSTDGAAYADFFTADEAGYSVAVNGDGTLVLTGTAVTPTVSKLLANGTEIGKYQYDSTKYLELEVGKTVTLSAVIDPSDAEYLWYHGASDGNRTQLNATADATTGAIKVKGEARLTGVTVGGQDRYYLVYDRGRELITLRVQVVEATSHTVTYDLQGHGDAIPSQTIAVDAAVQTATKPADPTATGYSFDGWYTDAACTADSKWDFDTDLTADITLYAKWLPKSYYMTLDAAGGTLARGDATGVYLTYGAACGALPTPTRSGYTFEGWFDASGAEITADTVLDKEYGSTPEDRTLTAQWTPLPATAPTVTAGSDRTLTYGYTGGSISVTATAADGHSITGYQWYRCDDAAKANATAITGATGSSFTVPTGMSVGTTYYYCAVTATRGDNSQTATADSAVITVTVGKADQTVTATNANVTVTYGETGKSVSAIGIGAVSYAVTAGADVVSVDSSTGALTILKVGNATITATAAGDANHNSDTATITVTVNKAEPTGITWPTVGAIYVGDTLTDDSLIGGAGEGTFSITGDKTWTSSGSKTTAVTFMPTDTANYTTATNDSIAVTVDQRTVESVTTIVPAITDKSYGTAQDALGLPGTVDILASGNKSFTVGVTWGGYNAHTLTQQTLTGTLDLSSFANEVKQADTAVTATATVTLQPLAPGSVTFADKTATYTGQPISHTIDTLPTGVASAVYTYVGTDEGNAYHSTAAPTDAGSYTVTAAFTMEEGYTQLPDAATALTINKAAATATAPTPNALTYTGEAQTLVAAGSATGGTMEYRLGASGDWSTTLPSATDAADYTVYYRVVGDKNHEDAAEASVSVTIGRQPVAIPQADATQFTYSGAAQTYTIADSALYTVSGNTQTAAGTYTVTVTLKDPQNYRWSDGTDTAKPYDFVIAQAAVTITVADQSAYVGAAAPDLSQLAQDKAYTVSGLIGEDTLTIAPTLAYDPAEPDMSKTGDAAKIVASGASAGDNYRIIYVDGKLTINARPSSGSSSTTVTVPVSSDSATVNVKAEVTQGNATVEVSDAQIEQVAADGAGSVIVDVSSLKNVTSATVPSHVVEKTNEAEDTALTVALPTGSVSLDETALESVTEAADGKDVTVSVVSIPTTNVSPVVKEIIGMEPTVVAVVDVNITVNGKKQSSFDGGKVTISIPYTPKKGEDTSKLTVWFIRDDGTIENKGGWYDAKNKCFVFETEHLSQYVLLNAPTAFTDVPVEKYFYPAVNWAVANSITGGTTATTFSPYASCTRGQLVTFLWRAAGKPEAKSTVNPFSDVKETSAFYNAILWAAENGIVTGYNDGTFRPGASVTRQQTAAILYRYAKFAKMDVSVGEDTNILSFNDALSVSEYAIPALQWAVGEGVITGNKGSLLPHDTCTRAQIVTMLYRLLAK